MSYPNPMQSSVIRNQGSGIIRVEIFVDKIELADIPIMQLMESSKSVSEIESVQRHLAYEYIETVNGLEVWIERPYVKNASDLDYDIRQAAEKELKYKVGYDNLIINYLN